MMMTVSFPPRAARAQGSIDGPEPANQSGHTISGEPTPVDRRFRLLDIIDEFTRVWTETDLGAPALAPIRDVCNWTLTSKSHFLRSSRMRSAHLSAPQW
jgi:hypothetical protein